MHQTPSHLRLAAPAARHLAVALALSGVALTASPAAAQPARQSSGAAVITPTGRIAPENFVDLIARVAPAVVRVTVTGRAEAAERLAELPPELRGTPFEEFFRRFGEGQGPQQRPRGRRPMGQGSGFIIDPAGFIVTNNHVVGEATRVTVELTDGRELTARVVGADPQTDIALLRVEAGGPLTAVTWGNSDRLPVGEWVVAMGNPFGLGGTATAGIVSARGRQIGAGPYDDFVQTDAPINPGNSGGPLFNPAGEVVGVNTAIFSPSGGNIGIGFAVPSNLAKRIIEDLRDDGKVERGWLGVSLQPLEPELAQALGVRDTKGAVVGAVEPGSPAARGGLRPGDVVVAAAGQPMQDPRDLAAAVAAAKPGSTIPLTVLRDGRRMEQRVTLGEPPGQRTAARGGPDQGRAGALGLGLTPRQGGTGVVVSGVEPGSVAAERGMQPGDVILRVGDRDANSPRDVVEAVNAAREAGRPAVAMQIERGENRAFVALPLRPADGATGGGRGG
jgi:serine protease Do